MFFLLLSRGTADKLLDDKSFIETHKESVMNIAYNIMYEDEYDDTYDTSGLNMRGIDLHTVDELDESNTNSHDKKEVINFIQIIFNLHEKNCTNIIHFTIVKD